MRSKASTYFHPRPIDGGQGSAHLLQVTGEFDHFLFFRFDFGDGLVSIFGHSRSSSVCIVQYKCIWHLHSVPSAGRNTVDNQPVAGNSHVVQRPIVSTLVKALGRFVDVLPSQFRRVEFRSVPKVSFPFHYIFYIKQLRKEMQHNTIPPVISV